MNHFSRKAPTFVFLGLLVALFALAWLFPSAGPRLGMAFLVVSLLVACLFIVKEQKAAYRRGRITRRVFLQNVLVEVAGVGLAMVLAGFMGRVAAAAVTAQIGDALMRFLAGCLIGLLAGLIAGFVVSRTWGRLVKGKAANGRLPQ